MLYRPFLLSMFVLALSGCSINGQSSSSSSSSSSCRYIKQEIHALYTQSPVTSHTPSQQPTSITKARLLDEYAAHHCEAI